MSQNRNCDPAKKFLRHPSCNGDLTTETLMVNSSEKNTDGNNYSISISPATEGIGFTCGEGAAMSQIKINGYNFDLCTNAATGRQNALGEMAVAGPKSLWTTVLVGFSAKNQMMTDEIIQILSSIK